MDTHRLSESRPAATDLNPLLEATLAHLRALVACDTRNPPRAIDTGGIFDYLRVQLPGFDVRVTDHGAGAVSLFAVRGRPTLLFNVHLDTVPDSPQWSASPFELRVTDERATGLGACDIKGAAAALLAVANAGAGDMALLFTTDEEASDARCIAHFLDTCSAQPTPSPESRVPAFGAVIVAEPTRCEAILAHRGMQAVRARFSGRAGHASKEQQPSDSAVHQAVRWGAAALDYAQAQATCEFEGLRGLRLNIGRVEGGIKSNVIAPEAEVRIGMRPLSSMDMDDLLERLRTLAESLPTAFEETFRGPPLPSAGPHAESRLHDTRALVDELGLPIGDAVDFWTEAALFSQAGYPTFVYGPGDISQAHTADEWVALEQLQRYAENIRRIVSAGQP